MTKTRKCTQHERSEINFVAKTVTTSVSAERALRRKRNYAMGTELIHEHKLHSQCVLILFIIVETNNLLSGFNVSPYTQEMRIFCDAL